MKKITEISSKGLYYRDDEKNFFIDFSICYGNWKNHMQRRGVVPFENEKAIGNRQSDAQPKHFEFFTQPFTKIEFFEDRNNDESGMGFYEVYKKLVLYGWSTIDLS